MLFLLQSTVFQSLSFNGIVPNLLIVLTASYGFMSGEKWGLIVGFFCGLLCDIFFGDVIGFHALIMMYIGYLNGKFSGGFYPEDIILPMVLNVLSDVSYGFLCYIFMFFTAWQTEFSLLLPACDSAGGCIYHAYDYFSLSIDPVCKHQTGQTEKKE